MKFLRPLILSASIVSCISLTAAAEENHSLAAHTHGHIEVNLAFSGSEGLLEIHAPAESIVGFEGGATTDQQRAAVSDATLVLMDLANIAVLSGCTATPLNVFMEDEDGHSEFVVEHELTCAKIPNSADFAPLFAAFPDIEEAEAQAVVGEKSFAAELESADSLMQLR